MNPGRILGVIMGIMILLAVLVLPFSSEPGSPSLYGIVNPLFSRLGEIQQSGDQAQIAFTYVYIISLILLVIAGIVGFFPLGCGVIGIVAMALITLGPMMIFPGGGIDVGSYGLGYFVAWIASIIALGASFWKAREKKGEATPSVNVTVTAPPTPPPPPPAEVIVSPTISVTQTQIAGEGRPLRPEEAQMKTTTEALPQKGVITPEEVAKAVDALKQKQSSGEISQEKLMGELGKLMYLDDAGKYWTIDFRTGRWVHYDGANWVEGQPPRQLRAV